MTSDSAVTNLALFNELPFGSCELDDTNLDTADYVRIRCFCHVVNLAVHSLPPEDLQFWDYMSRTSCPDDLDDIPELVPLDSDEEL
ncbi:hypothetical protein K435DRAFT_251304 [Dendrothele bispora CBS 962.96]|uniref:Uncharacterized protein n=1 Tax=Dendrothele bispora (strain CBS 962.96) TaxID=1314807 RepID=A0A4S8LNC1_DENBC|nr:hypothetical protein K435DRAFT_251304 [Dendrothele bispora CBS 962.96]